MLQRVREVRPARAGVSSSTCHVSLEAISGVLEVDTLLITS
jgi:hypothetical protein